MTIFEIVTIHATKSNNKLTAGKLRDELSRWRRLGGAAELADITPDNLDTIRENGLKRGLSAKTIESTLSDLIGACNRQGVKIEYGGSKLRLPQPAAKQPTLEQFGAAYLHTDAATWPSPRQKLGEWQGSPGDFWRLLFCLGYFTGFRLSDLIGLRWDGLSGDTITRTANKTGKTHVIPVGAVLRRHLEAASRNSDRILGVRRGSKKQIHDGFVAICDAAGVPLFTAQQIRALSVTEWASANAEAGRIIHGEKLGVLSHYYNTERILRRTLPQLRVPDAMLTQDEREAKTLPLAELSQVCDRLTPERIRDLVRLAGALC